LSSLNDQGRPNWIISSRSFINRWLHHLVEPLVLFSIVAILMLLVIWGSTYFLVNKERVAIERQVALSVGEITDTYEARVVRALREIDTALKLVRLPLAVPITQACWMFCRHRIYCRQHFCLR
jgi:hypothetical protein